jgi:hypothetical protein
VSFQIDAQGAMTGPAGESFGDGGEENVVDVGAIDGRNIFKQSVGLIGREPDGDDARGACGVAALREVDGERSDRMRNSVEPVGGFGTKGFGVGVVAKTGSPVQEGSGFEREVSGLTVPELFVDTLQIFEKDAPGDTVDG